MSKFSDNARSDHLAVAKMTAFALTLGDVDAWHAMSVVLTARLTAGERARLAWAALRSLTPEDAGDVIDAVFPQDVPLPSLLTPMSEATLWAEAATLDDRKAYAAACFIALPAAEQNAFMAHFGRRAA